MRQVGAQSVLVVYPAHATAPLPHVRLHHQRIAPPAGGHRLSSRREAALQMVRCDDGPRNHPFGWKSREDRTLRFTDDAAVFDGGIGRGEDQEAAVTNGQHRNPQSHRRIQHPPRPELPAPPSRRARRQPCADLGIGE